MISVHLYGSCPNECEPWSNEAVTAYTLRHSFSKNLVDAGTPQDHVAILLGYASLDTTLIYTQPSEPDLERAVRNAAGENLE